MKLYRTILTVAAAILAIGAMSSCAEKWEEITDVNLTRCLQPMGLSAKVNQGQNVTFGWDVAKDAEYYTLAVYSDAGMTEEVFSESVKPSEVPVTKYMDVDMSYWFKVMAHNSTKDDSKWAEYGKEIKTYAVKPNLYMKLDGRASNSLSFVWNADKEVDRIEVSIPGSEAEPVVYQLTDADIEAGKATVSGLMASTEYVAILYYSSANRGEVNAWTMPDMTGLTEVSTNAALEQALKDGANILLKMEGSPYSIGADLAKGFDLDKAVKIYGEGAADGSLPVIEGSFNVTDNFDGGDIYAEGIEFNGKSNTCGFLIQHKEGSANNDLAINSIVFKNCIITGYSKGLLYEWGKTMKIGEFTFDSCDINAVNVDGSNGGDGIDLRNATSVDRLNLVNNTIRNGFRTFLRIDANPVIGDVVFENNTLMNLSFVDNTNNGGLIAFQTAPKSFSFKKNLFLNMTGKAVLTGAAAKYVSGDNLNLAASENYFYNLVETFFTDNFTLSMAAGTILDADPCFNAKGGLFNIKSSSPIAGQKIGASKWWSEYVEEPEDLTMIKIEEGHTWDFTNAKYFSSDFTKSKVRDMLLFGVKENKITYTDGVLGFTAAAVTSRKGVPTDGYLAFLVDKPGSLIIKPLDENNTGNHLVVGAGPVSGSSISIKGGASAMSDMDNAQKILVKDITEETLIYIYPTGPVSLEKLAWSTDTTAVNTALPAPAPVINPEKVVAGEPAEITVSWEPVENAGSYSVVFSGKTYVVEECSYSIAETVVGMLDPGSYKVQVYANPGKDDIYNTMSEAGVAAFAVQPAGGSAETGAFVVSSVEELLTAISAGKDAITLKYSDTPYEIGALTLTTPLHLYGQTSEGKKTPIVASFTLSGEIGGSVILSNLDITNEAVSVLIEDKVTAPIVDTVAVVNCNIHGTKALYDNSGKAASCVQVLRFRDNFIDNCSNGADFIDLRTGAHHTVTIVNNTFANSCRTFMRTDAVHELNYLTVRNNTFYKVATNSSSKDNNGIFHVRSTGGAGLMEYKVINNLFYSILLDTDPSNAAGFPKFRSKGGLDPVTVVNNYFYNCEDREEKAAYSFWTYFSKDAAIAGGGAILPSDPFRDAANGDYTLINGVAMNANVGDPRWNSMKGNVPSSEITVKNTEEFLTAISAGKSTITLAAGQYDLVAASAEGTEVMNGKLSLNSSLNLIGEDGAEFIGGFQFKEGVIDFTARNIVFNGNSSVDNVFEVAEATVKMNSFSVKNSEIKNYKNRLFYMGQTSLLSSLEFCGNIISGVDGANFTSGDFIDIRKGTVYAVQFHNNTVANAGRTFLRMDASVIANSVLVANNTFYNMGFVDSKDNNGMFHVRSTVLDESAYIVKNNIFAGMHRAVETPSNANGYPKLVSTNVASKIPSFKHNYFNDLDILSADYNFWTKDKVTEELATAGNGVVLKDSPFKDAAKGDFTLVNALAASERVGDSRWNTLRPDFSGESFPVANVDEMLMAIAAGKKDLILTGSEYDLTAVEGNENIVSGVLNLTDGITINGKLIHGIKPVLKAGFKLSIAEGSFILNNLVLDGVSSIGNMIEVLADANLSSVVVKDCEVKAYTGRLVSGPAVSSVASLLITRNNVHDMGTSGDFIDFRKGGVSSIKVVSNSFYNGIRTFLRVDASVNCTSIAVKNNTFYNIGSVDSKDNNGIMHVRSTAATADPRQIVVEKNIFAGMHRAAETPSNTAAGFPHLISKTSSAIAIPTFRDNLFFDIETEAPYSWWQYPEGFDPASAGTVLDATPFAGDPATGKFTVTAGYKGYGDLRW